MSHIQPLTSLIGVTVGFNQSLYSALEEDASGKGSVVEICIDLFGTLERSVMVAISTMNGTAIGTAVFPYILTFHQEFLPSIAGGADYDEVLALQTTIDLTFERTKRDTAVAGPLTETECVPLFILSDSVVEDDETFTVQLTSSDPLVMLYPASTNVVIINNDREFDSCLSVPLNYVRFSH